MTALRIPGTTYPMKVLRTPELAFREGEVDGP